MFPNYNSVRLGRFDTMASATRPEIKLQEIRLCWSSGNIEALRLF